MEEGPALNPDLVITGDKETFIALGSRSLSPRDALKSGKGGLKGERAAFARSVEMFAWADAPTNGVQTERSAAEKSRTAAR